MGEIIHVGFGSQAIDVAKVVASRRQLDEGMLLPASGDFQEELAQEHTPDPIKSIEDIERIASYFIQKERYRDHMLFVLGINLGLRASDLRMLRFSHLIDENFCFKRTFPILEKKTKNTRKVQKNRYLTINDAIVDAVTLYLQHTTGCKLDDYLFPCHSNRGINSGEPIHRNSIERILKEAASELGIKAKVATHTLRKTFGYHQMMMSGNDPRKLLLLQKIYGHSSAAQTLDYIGLTPEEIEDAYLNLNLAGKNCYAKFSRLSEGESA